MAKHGNINQVTNKKKSGKHAATTMESVAKKVLIVVLVFLIVACVGLFYIIMNTPSTQTTTTSLSALSDLSDGPNIKVTSGAADGTSNSTDAGEVKKYDSTGEGVIDYRIQVQYKSDDSADKSGLMTITDTLPEYTEANMIDGGYVVAESSDGTTTILGTPAYNETTREVTFQVKNLDASTDSKPVVYTYKIQAKVTEDADSLNADTINYKNVATLKSGSQTIESNKVNYTSGNSGNAQEPEATPEPDKENGEEQEVSTVQYKGTYSWDYLESTDDGVTANVPESIVVDAGATAEISAYPRVDEGNSAPSADDSDPYSSLYEKYVFLGWECKSDNNSATLKDGVVSNISGNFQLIGSWKKREYSLTFVTNDGTDISQLGVSNKAYKRGEIVEIPVLDDCKLKSARKRFLNWSFDSEPQMQGENSFVMPTANVLATANLADLHSVEAKFADIFAGDGSTSLIEGVQGDDVVLKPRVFEGITFKEWKFASGKPSSFAQKDDGSATFKIEDSDIHCEAVYEIEVTFEVQNGTMYDAGADYNGKKVKKIKATVEASGSDENPTWEYALLSSDIPSVATSDAEYESSVIRPDSSSTYEGSAWESTDESKNVWGEPVAGMKVGISLNQGTLAYRSENVRFVYAYQLLPTGNISFTVNDDEFGYLSVNGDDVTYGANNPYEIKDVDLVGSWVKNSAGADISVSAHNKPGYKFKGWQLQGDDDLLADANSAIDWHPIKVSYLNGTSAAYIPGVYVAVFERNYDEVTTDSIRLDSHDIYISIDEAAEFTDVENPATLAKLINLADLKAEHAAEPHDPIKIASVSGEIKPDRGIYNLTFSTEEVFSVTDAGKKMQETVSVKVYVRSGSTSQKASAARLTANDFILSVDEASSIAEGKKPGSGFNLFKAFADNKLNDGKTALVELASAQVVDDEIIDASLDYSGAGSGDYTATFKTSSGLSLNVKAQVCDNVYADSERGVRIGANSAHISVEDAGLLLDKDTKTASTLTALLKPIAYNTETGEYVQIDEVSQNIAADDGSYNVKFSTSDKSSINCTFDVGNLSPFAKLAKYGSLMFALIGVLAVLALASAGVLIYARRRQLEYEDEE